MNEISLWLGILSLSISLLAIPIAWVWKLSKWDSAIKSVDSLTKQMKSLEDRLTSNEKRTERALLITEPLWDSICSNLPGILKLHNSPDPLSNVLLDQDAPGEAEDLLKRMSDEVSKVRDTDPNRALALCLALWAVRVKLSERKLK